MTSTRISTLLLFLLAVTLSSCKKEGVGGDASIRGYVQVRQYNSTFTQFIAEYPGRDVYVYLVFDNNIGYDKRIKTDYNGNFEFRYLYKGDYKVYVYSRDSTLQDLSGIVPVVKEVAITERKEIFDLDTLPIFQ